METNLATPIGEEWVFPDDIGVFNKHLKSIIPMLEKAWAPVRAMNIHDIEVEPVPSFIVKNEPTDPVIHIEIEVKSEGYDNLTMSLCYPLSKLEPTLADLE